MPKNALVAYAAGVSLVIELPNSPMPHMARINVRRTSAKGVSQLGSVSMCCPKCATDKKSPQITSVKQQYTCEHGHGPFAQSDLHRKLPHGDGHVTPQQFANAAEAISTDKNDRAVRLTPVLASTFEGYEAGATYVLEADDAMSTQLIDLLNGSLGDDDTIGPAKRKIVMIGWMDGQKGVDRKLVRLVRRFDQLCVTELVYPSDIRDDIPAGEFGKRPTKSLNAFKSMLAEAAVEYDPTTYANPAATKVERLVGAITEPEAEPDVMAMFEKALATS